jgi:hypothetical protein
VRLSERGRQPGETREAALAKCVMGDDPTTKALWAAYRKADGPEPTTWDGEEDDADDVPTTSPGYDAMMEKAQKLMVENPGKYTLPGAFKTVYAEHPELVAMDKAAHFGKVAKAMGY